MEIVQYSVDVVAGQTVKGRMRRNDGNGVTQEQTTSLLVKRYAAFVLNLTDLPHRNSTCNATSVNQLNIICKKMGIKPQNANRRITGLLTIGKVDTVFQVLDTKATALDSFAGS